LFYYLEKSEEGLTSVTMVLTGMYRGFRSRDVIV